MLFLWDKRLLAVRKQVWSLAGSKDAAGQHSRRAQLTLISQAACRRGKCQSHTGKPQQPKLAARIMQQPVLLPDLGLPFGKDAPASTHSQFAVQGADVSVQYCIIQAYSRGTAPLPGMLSSINCNPSL